MAKTPQFAAEQEEADFWDTHDSTDYMDGTEEVDITFVDARPKIQISLRLAPSTISKLKSMARKRGIGYQTLIRMWVMERINQEPG
jgi:predicted DNA binding CopG/RHH family protein